MKIILFLTLAALAHAQQAVPPADGPRAQDILAAATKGVALLQKVGASWYQKHSCTSCHHHTLPIMAWVRARAHGVPVDEQMAARHIRLSLDYLRLDRAVQGSWQGNVPNEEALALIAAHEAGVPPALIGAAYARLIAGKQLADGHWLSAGNRPPQDYSEVTTAARALRTLRLFLPDRMAGEREAQIGRAKTWLEAQNPKATEEQTFRLFGLAWANASKGLLKSAADRLLRIQQADGGWAQLPGLVTDAYSTAEVLVALHEAAGVPASHNAFKKGIAYLVKSQRDDGSWFVKSRIVHPAEVSPPYFESGFPYHKDQYISCMATSWAVMALSLTLPAVKDLPGLKVDGLLAERGQPWAETMLFGSAAELRELLRTGFDPNSKDAHGTTALMMAIPNYEKVRLLVDAGADVNQKAESRFTPLMVATAYRGTANIVRLLLDKGAAVEPGDPAPVYNASAAFLAVVAADAETLKLLVDKGADLTRKMFTFGFFENDAFEWAAFGGDPANVKYLAGRNVSASKLGEALIVSVISNRLVQVRDLLDAGANVNYVDKHGMTPLLYAASLDFGSTGIAESLLKARAEVKARSKDGATALTIARKYGYSDLQRVLERAGATE